MVSLGFVKLLLWAFVFTTARGSSLWPPLNRTPIRYEFSLTWETHSPDGFARKMILTNGQFPGPSIEVTQGDEVEVAVTNLMPFNTTIHFHGIDQVGTPWSDGVPGVTQKPISPGATFVYRWTATDYGTYWYHAHERGQASNPDLPTGLHSSVAL
jgi:FtsP/CotA-like multicopper oxidase with cupredoxin domain